MMKCEKCGVSFAPPEGPTEVTSTRVLCPACGAAYAAEKRRQLAARAAGTPPGGKPVKRRSLVIGLTGTAEVGITTIIDHDEQDVRPAC